jgi:ADP-ribose pyrophosphatase YjhB (NUDIX family)
MKQIHPIQMQILKNLLFNQELRFSELKPNETIENNQFTFHLDKLIGDNLVQKISNKYSLTSTGKEFANTMDTDEIKIQKQTKVSAVTCAMRIRDCKYEYLIYTRLKHPFYGHQGFPSGKVKWGEKIIDACKREFFEETKLLGKPELFTIHHHHVYDKNTNKLLEDKLFFIFKIVNPKGRLRANNEGNFEWIKEAELKKYIIKPFGALNDILKVMKLAKSNKTIISVEEFDEFTEEF